MGERFDRFRSIVKGAADSATDAAKNVRGLAGVREALRELRDRRARIPERQLARAVLRAGTVSAASVRTRGGRIEITAELESGRAVRVALIPDRAQFAPHGAKEIFFRVEPPEAAADAKVRDIAGLFASQIARALWSPVLGAAEGIDDGGLVDREADGQLRIDLRTCPVVRAAQSKQAAALVMDVITIERFDVDEQGLSIKLALPKIPGS